MNMLLSPLIAFLLYLLLVGVLSGFGRLLAGPSIPGEMKSGLYASGESPPTAQAAPGYRPFFVTTLFFAVLHLGALVIALGGTSWIAVIYLAGLVFALLALILG
jgi:NADH:ubiquinone oxidoreductase subunit 3 (subunit A)